MYRYLGKEHFQPEGTIAKALRQDMHAVFNTSKPAICLVHSMPGGSSRWRYQFLKAPQVSVKMGRKLLKGFDHRRDRI